MYGTSFAISFSLTLCIIAASSLYEERFTALRPQTTLYRRDHGLSSYLFAREAIPFEHANQEPWGYGTDLLRRYAQPWLQLDSDFELGNTRLYARTPGKGYKQGKRGKGNAGNPGNQNKAPDGAGADTTNNKKPPHGAMQGETSNNPKSPKSAAKDSSTSDTIPSKNEILSMVKQNYNWPPPDYKHMNKNERRIAGAKVLQEHRRRLQAERESAASGTSVQDMIKKFQGSHSEQLFSSSDLTSKAAPKKDAGTVPPVSKFAHGPGSSDSSWASLSRQSSLSRSATPGPEALNRQESSKSTLSGVHVEKPSVPSRQHSGAEDWTVL